MTQLVDQPSAAPTRKLTWGALAGAVGVALIHGLEQIAQASPTWWGWLSEPTVTGLVPLAMATVTSYFVRERAPG